MKALLLGYYGANNLGDDMMLHCLLQWLIKQDIKITVVSECPSITSTRFSVQTVQNVPLMCEWEWWTTWSKGRPFKLLKSIYQHEALIVGGGDLIRDDRSWRIFSYTVSKIVVALLMKKPVFLVNIGITNPTTSCGRFILKTVFKKCRKIIVRDQSSYDVCKSLDYPATKLYLMPDIVLKLPKYVIMDSSKNNVLTQPYIIVSMRMDPNAFNGYIYEEKEIDAFAKSLDKIITKQSVNVMFIPFHYDERNDDNILHKRIRNRMTNVDKAIIIEWTSSYSTLIRYFSNSVSIVAMRLHAAVLGVAVSKPVVLMPYDKKVNSFGNLVGINRRIPADKASDANYIFEMLLESMSMQNNVYLESLTDWDDMTIQI